MGNCLIVSNDLDKIIAFLRPFKPDTDRPQCVCLSILWCARCFPLWSSSSSTIGIILRYVEVFSESVSAPLIFSSANISFKSLWREFCGSDFRSFPVISKLIRKLIIRKLMRFQYLLWKTSFKSYLSLSMNSMITWKHGPTYWIIKHANKMV